jgi:hypothetical protein
MHGLPCHCRSARWRKSARRSSTSQSKPMTDPASPPPYHAPKPPKPPLAPSASPLPPPPVVPCCGPYGSLCIATRCAAAVRRIPRGRSAHSWHCRAACSHHKPHAPVRRSAPRRPPRRARPRSSARAADRRRSRFRRSRRRRGAAAQRRAVGIWQGAQQRFRLAPIDTDPQRYSPVGDRPSHAHH